eukprot:TRINITY_DN1574_c0_g1_i10.p1 TRINITY_DN1574_c0_g1~~TRINITY_DN1574_c0_g1_i10.p1  ORF type:complete len:287 (-),score=59.76 TRINITY_DN1574_c0_g1_i10:618-1478(-)
MSRQFPLAREAGLIFRQLDQNGDGVLNPEEFMGRLSDFGVPDNEIERLFSCLDTDNDGLVNLQEFYSGYSQFVLQTSEKVESFSEPVVGKITDFYDWADNGALGDGMMASVAKATVKATQRQVAIKTVNEKWDKKQECNFKEEVTLLKSLTHPNVIHFVDFMYEAPNYYLVTELVTGGELLDRIVEKQFYNEGDAKKLVGTLLDITQYLHRLKMVHRDYKPENVLLATLDNDFDIKLADFGFATVCEGRSLSVKCGTPGYMAPEMLQKGPKYGVLRSLSCDGWCRD